MRVYYFQDIKVIEDNKENVSKLKKDFNITEENVKKEEKENTEFDSVNRPKHYLLFPEYNIEVRDLMLKLAKDLDSKNFNGLLISDYIQAMQYLLRWHNKNGVEDIKKALWYLNKIVESLESEDIKNG